MTEQSSPNKKALDRVIEAGPSSKRQKTLEEWIPELQAYDVAQFDELPWPAKSLIFTFSKPEDMKTLCKTSKLFSQYCNSRDMEDFWRRRVADVLQLQKIRDAGLPFKMKHQPWAIDWILLKPISQWSLMDFDMVLDSQHNFPYIPIAKNWFVAWVHAVQTKELVERYYGLFNLPLDNPDAPVMIFYFVAGLNVKGNESLMNNTTDIMRAIFLTAKVIGPQFTPDVDWNYTDHMIDILSNWNFQNGTYAEASVGLDEDKLIFTYNLDIEKLVLRLNLFTPVMKIGLSHGGQRFIDDVVTFPANELEFLIYNIDTYIAKKYINPE